MKTEPITKITKDIVPKALSLLPALTDSLPVLILYLFTVLWYTVLNRAENYEIPQLELFWSFRKVLSGDSRLGSEIVGNVIMFMPFGFLLCDLFYKWNPARITMPSAFSTSSSTSTVQAKRKSGGSRNFERYGKWLLIPLLALSFSLLIESLQLTLVRGLAEADDLFTNTLGSVLGICTFEVLRKLCATRLFEAIPIIQKNTIRKNSIRKNPISGTEKCAAEMFETLCSVIRIIFVFLCLIVLIFNRKIYLLTENNLTRSFCFQIDEVSAQGNDLTIRGFAFGYDRRLVPPQLVLRPTKINDKVDMDVTFRPTKTGNKADTDVSLRQTETEDTIVLDVNYGTARPDVNKYFFCDYDYTDVGFTATGIVNPEIEYEIMISWPLTTLISTGVYILGEDVHRIAYKETYSEDMIEAKKEDNDIETVKDEGPSNTGEFEMPDLSTDFIKNGTLLVYRPDAHIWIFQYDGSLYWVADEGFYFEDDGTTKIQYQLWTTQLQNLPSDRLKKRHLWDNIGGYFEKYELSGNFGKYRVMCRELPTEYSIASILTGYYKEGEWDWANSFRPVYEF